MLLYSASAEDKDTLPCFLDFQEIELLPRNTTYPLTDLLVCGKLPNLKHNRLLERNLEIYFFAEQDAKVWLPFNVP